MLRPQHQSRKQQRRWQRVMGWLKGVGEKHDEQKKADSMAHKKRKDHEKAETKNLMSRCGKTKFTAKSSRVQQPPHHGHSNQLFTVKSHCHLLGALECEASPTQFSREAGGSPPTTAALPPKQRRAAAAPVHALVNHTPSLHREEHP